MYGVDVASTELGILEGGRRLQHSRILHGQLFVGFPHPRDTIDMGMKQAASEVKPCVCGRVLQSGLPTSGGAERHCPGQTSLGFVKAQLLLDRASGTADSHAAQTRTPAIYNGPASITYR